MVAPSVAVNRPLPLADANETAHLGVLVEMAERKIPAIHGLLVRTGRLSAVYRGDGGLIPTYRARNARRRREHRLRLAELVRIVQQHDIAFIVHRHVLERLDDFVADPAGVESIVRTDFRALELAGDSPLRP